MVFISPYDLGYLLEMHTLGTVKYKKVFYKAVCMPKIPLFLLFLGGRGEVCPQMNEGIISLS